ncbi:hypothetical protein D3C80_981260 [compost metagenome]
MGLRDIDSLAAHSTSPALPCSICSPAWRRISKPVPQMRCTASAGTACGTPLYRPMWRGRK